MMSIEEIQDEIISDFELFENWEDKYGYIVELGKKLVPMDESYKTDDLIIKGCQSRVWLRAYLQDGRVQFETDSDAIIVKGLIYLILKVFQNQTPDAIVSTPIYFIDRIGMAQHLSQTRANGLVAMVKQVQLYALAFKAQQAVNQ